MSTAAERAADLQKRAIGFRFEHGPSVKVRSKWANDAAIWAFETGGSERLLSALSAAALSPRGPNVSARLRLAMCRRALLRPAKIETMAFVGTGILKNTG